MPSAIINLGWYAVFHLAAFGVGWAIASTGSGDKMVPVGFAAAVIAGPLLALLSSAARRLDRERYVVRVELDRFRFVWLWSTIWFGGALIGAWAVADQLFYTSGIQKPHLVLGAGGMVVAGWFARIAGRKREFLRVDLAAGVVEHVGAGQPLACSLDQVGRFEVETYRRANIGRGHNPDWYRLIAPGFPKRVFADSVYPGGVRALGEELQRRLDDLRDVAALRRVLAETPTGGANYRAGASLDDAVRAAVEDPDRRKVALAALARDPDAEVRGKLGQLRS